MKTATKPTPKTQPEPVSVEVASRMHAQSLYGDSASIAKMKEQHAEDAKSLGQLADAISFLERNLAADMATAYTQAGDSKPPEGAVLSIAFERKEENGMPRLQATITATPKQEG